MSNSLLRMLLPSSLALCITAPALGSCSTDPYSPAYVDYVNYGGDGSPRAGWPVESTWVTFEKAWSSYLEMMKNSCKIFHVAENSEEELSSIREGLTIAAEQSGVDQRFLFAIMIQESKGCVRVPTTNNGQTNPGLMQSFNGEASCFKATSCSKDTIVKMIMEGTGIGPIFGLKQAISQSAASDVSMYYKGARIYNSGSVDGSGNLGAGIATHCYASDIANRLRGVVFLNSPCNEKTIGSLKTSEGCSNYKEDTVPPTSIRPTTPLPKYTNYSGVGKKTETNISISHNNLDPNTPKAEGANANCTKWFTPSAGDTCQTAGISFSKLRELNSKLDEDCSNMWAGYQYCVSTV